MAFRRFFNTVIKTSRPVLYTTGSIFVKSSETSESRTDTKGKIEWEPPDFSKFTYEHMIKKSTMDTVNSISEVLTITYTAIENTSDEYRHTLSMLMSLLKDTLAHRVGDSHWDLIVAARSEVQKKKRRITQLVAFMDYVQKMGVAATEASYMAGLDNLSLTLAQRMDDALNNMNREIKHNAVLELEYTMLQEECIRKSNSDELSKKQEDIEVENILVD
ncbi:uncharacterized protein [Venturia canescens]|uniref:uncharacterized protein isoform X2 n=1 Tax=Venturia canescens TaxID=32260 RepID=UPI001C9D37CD|nr:uncharacterized protein LOC122415795 isoform X2 [Venturia canescens]